MYWEGQKGTGIQNRPRTHAATERFSKCITNPGTCHYPSDFPHASRQLSALDIWTLGRDRPTLVPVRPGQLSDVQKAKWASK